MYEIFEMLCSKNGVTPYRVHKETGIAKSTLSDWKNGISTPKQDKLKLIADFFHVSVDYLMTGKDEKFTIEMADMDTELIFMDKKLKEYALRMAKLSKDDQTAIMQMIDRFSK